MGRGGALGDGGSGGGALVVGTAAVRFVHFALLCRCDTRLLFLPSTVTNNVRCQSSTHQPTQPPRLTGVLRALVTAHGADFDAAKAFLQRKAALEEARAAGAGGGDGGQHLTAAELQQRLLGPKRECFLWFALWGVFLGLQEQRY
jgi:hypothetical protein